jgi:hypothetical protein
LSVSYHSKDAAASQHDDARAAADWQALALVRTVACFHAQASAPAERFRAALEAAGLGIPHHSAEQIGTAWHYLMLSLKMKLKAWGWM